MPCPQAEALERQRAAAASPLLSPRVRAQVGFASPTGKASSAALTAAAGSLITSLSARKGAPGPLRSALKAAATPKLRGLGSTSVLERTGRTPTEALSEALSAKRRDARDVASPEEDVAAAMAGVPDGAAPVHSPIPFRAGGSGHLHLEVSPASRVVVHFIFMNTQGKPPTKGTHCGNKGRPLFQFRARALFFRCVRRRPHRRPVAPGL